MANSFVIFIEYYKNKKITKVHLLMISVLFSDIIFALSTHVMVTLAFFGISADTLFGKYGKLFI